MNIIFKVLCLCVLVGSCASLSKTQLNSVRQFAQISKDFSAYPSTMMRVLAQVRLKRSVYYALTLSDAKLHLAELDSIQKQRAFDAESVDKVDITFKIIDTYSQSLLLLTSDQFEKELAQRSQSFGVNIDSLVCKYNLIEGQAKVPLGLGGALNQIMLLAGKQYLRTRQAKEIKKYVTLADTLVGVMTYNLLRHLESAHIADLIQGEERAVSQSYLSYLRLRHPVSLEHDSDYLEMIHQLHEIKTLQRETIVATRALRVAHHKLFLSVQKRKDLKAHVEELQLLAAAVGGLKESIEKISKTK
ncbi:MAG TPA: hypothetical protein VL947_11590 [Cytophagales bacterium]|nr:hypothetical protein [Cytophagales bacterium]